MAGPAGAWAAARAPPLVWRIKPALALAAALMAVTSDAASTAHGQSRQPQQMYANNNCMSLHIAINSVHGYKQPRELLLQSLRNAGVPMDQVHVFLGDHPDRKSQLNASQPNARNALAWQAEDGVHYYAIAENSVDFTAMVHIVEHPILFREVRTWFYTHDTTMVGPRFWNVLSEWCSGLPSCAVPLMREDVSFSVGLYSSDYLLSFRQEVLKKKNVMNVAAHKWKERCIAWEDSMFRTCDETDERSLSLGFQVRCGDRPFSERTCICSKHYLNRTRVQVYGPLATPRYQFQFECLDFVKFAANIGEGPLILAE
eukprot:4213709-Pleurochrysis_carterae.AAC.5